MKRKSLILIVISLIVLASLLLFINYPSGIGKNLCNSSSVDECSGECVVCPPCEVCSSISCQTEEFCEGIGFNRSWYEDMRLRINNQTK